MKSLDCQRALKAILVGAVILLGAAVGFWVGWVLGKEPLPAWFVGRVKTYWLQIRLCEVGIVIILPVLFAGHRTLTLKRITVWIVESAAATVLVGAFLTSFVLRGSLGWMSVGSRYFVGVDGTFEMLLMAYYYVTIAIFGVALRSETKWLYPAIAATFFAVHARIIYWLLGVGGFVRAREIPFIAGGACLVFGCAFLGNHILRNWRKQPPANGLSPIAERAR